MPTQRTVASPELPISPGLVDDHDAAGRIRHISRDGVDGKSAVVQACLAICRMMAAERRGCGSTHKRSCDHVTVTICSLHMP